MIWSQTLHIINLVCWNIKGSKVSILSGDTEGTFIVIMLFRLNMITKNAFIKINSLNDLIISTVWLPRFLTVHAKFDVFPLTWFFMLIYCHDKYHFGIDYFGIMVISWPMTIHICNHHHDWDVMFLTPTTLVFMLSKKYGPDSDLVLTMTRFVKNYSLSNLWISNLTGNS